VRPWLAVVAGVLAGLVAGAIWTWAQPDRYRADARVLVRPDSSRIVPAVQALAESSLVATNVQQTLRLASPPSVSAKTGKGGLLTVSVEAGSRERARQIDAEAVTVLTQKVAQRFGTTVNVTATVLDPAHAAEQTSPTPGRNLLITGLAGLVGGLAVAGSLARARPRPAQALAVDPAAGRRLQTRIDEVAKRERAMARRAGELAAREQQLNRREQELAASASRSGATESEAERRLIAREAELAAGEAALAAAASLAEPEAPGPAEVTAGEGWNLRTLERLVDEHRGANPEAADAWATYLFFLREHADAEGALPRSFDDLVADVFGNLPGLLSSRDE
jgi:capsular polysaccharide biosynthesis protein